MSTPASTLTSARTTRTLSNDSLRRTLLVPLGALLAAVSVAAELIHPVQAPDGSTTQPWVLAGYVTLWTLGWVLVAIGHLRPRPRGDRRRTTTIGSRLVGAGAAALALSGAGQLVGVLTGAPTEVMFVLFLVGLPLLVVGCIVLAVSSRRTAPWVAGSHALAAVGLLMALTLEADPFHDIGVIAGTLALGAALLVPRRRD